MLISALRRLSVSKSLVFVLCSGFLLVFAIAGAPTSRAWLQSPTASESSISSSSTKRRRPEIVPGQALVRFKPNRAFEGSTFVALPSENKAQGGDATQGLAVAPEQIPVQIERFGGSDLIDGLRLVHAAAADTWKAIAALKAREDVFYAEPDYVVHALKTPNDPSFGQLYGMTKIGAPQAWDTVTGSSSIVVGVIDEGIDISHPDLAANIWTNPSPGSIAGISGDVHGYNFVNSNGTITPATSSESHATHVSGTIGAVGNNGVGVVGVNWQVSLMSLKFLDSSGSGFTSDAIRAYTYAKQMRDLWESSGHTKGANIRAVNASFGGGGFLQAESDAINALGQSGVLFVAAAGNDGTNSDLAPSYPASYGLPNIIQVAATDQSDLLAGFSTFGPHSVLMGAPGVNILSTTPNNTYSSFSGTSMSTPHVTGAAALLSAANPNLTINQLRALLAFNGDIVPSLQSKTLTGRRLNVFNSLQALASNDTTPPGTVGNFQVASQNGRSIGLSWTASGDDGATGQASLYDISFTDQASAKVIPLTAIAPAPSGTPQTVSFNLPYQHSAGTIKLREFDKVGNEGTPATTSVSIDPAIADPYVPSLNASAALTAGGTPLGLTFDDRYRQNFALPFSFPFFGQSYNTVTISTNGNLYFSPPSPPLRSNGDADDVPSSVDGLSQFKMIAGLWDDLTEETKYRPDADIYVVKPNATTIIFRWQGVPCNDQGSGCTGGDPVNFEIELDSNGAISIRYGSGNTNMFPVVGISGGEPDAYVISSLTSENIPISLTNAQSVLFTPRAAATPTPTPTPTPAYVVSGRVADGGSVGINNATVTFNLNLAGTLSSQLSLTDSNGNYTSVNLGCQNNVTVTPFKPGFSFGPASMTFTSNSGCLSGNATANFTATAAGSDAVQLSATTYNIGEGGGSALITVTRTGDTSGGATVDFATSDGTAKQRTDYTITTGTLTFNPGDVSKTFAVPVVDNAYVDGSRTVNLTLSNAAGATLSIPSTAILTIADNDTPTSTSPAPKRFGAALTGSQETPPTGSSATGQGYVLLNGPETSGQAGLVFTGLSSTETAAHIHGAGAVGIAAPIIFPLPTSNPVTNFSFSPTSQQVSDLKAGLQYMNVHSNNFLNGETRGQLLWNPTLEENFFVRQTYLDFLGREPDTSGFNFWTGTITACVADAICLHNNTVSTSDAFFFEPEFHQTAGFVFLVYRAAYGNTQPFPNPDSSNPAEANKLPNYANFVADRARVVGGANLTASQEAFANLVVTRPEFVSRYSASLTGAQFVSALLANIQTADGVDLSSQQTALVNQYNNAGGGNAGRGLVLFSLALDDAVNNPINNRAFVNAEYNRQFALTLYFGYLRRNPDIGGFLFWQSQINSAAVGNVHKQQSLVCSYITSAEYQLRFGPSAPRSNQECPP